MTFIVRDTSNGNTREVPTREDAAETKNDLVALGADPSQIEIEAPDGGEEPTAEVVDMTEDDADDVPEPSALTSDPLDVIAANADQFTDTIQGTVTINRQGYAVLAEHFDIAVEAEPVTLASATDFDYAEFRAVAETPDGQTYTGFGSAHVNRDDGDSPYLLNELAETRAMKRACAWATGVGMSAVEELENDL